MVWNFGVEFVVCDVWYMYLVYSAVEGKVVGNKTQRGAKLGSESLSL